VIIVGIRSDLAAPAAVGAISVSGPTRTVERCHRQHAALRSGISRGQTN
jgi:hypothetical protein